MTGLNQDRAGNSVNPAHSGISSLDSRRRTGSAGGAALSGMGLRARQDRAERIAREWAAGKSQFEIAAEFGVTGARVSQIIQSARQDEALSAQRACAEQVKHQKVLALLVEYECGFGLREIAERHGLKLHTLRDRLVKTGRFVARRHGNAGGLAYRVPEFVPVEHIDRWRRLAGLNGVEIADRCIRNMLAWEAR